MPVFRRFLLVMAAAACLPGMAAPCRADQTPAFDASGDWILHVVGPRLLYGDCPIDGDGEYDKPVHIHQHGQVFVIAIDDGPVEHGTVDGRVYSHSATQEGTDVTGIGFRVTARSTFTLASPDRSTGRTTLDIRFEDGSRCLLDLEFEGERDDPANSGAPLHPDLLRPA